MKIAERTEEADIEESANLSLSGVLPSTQLCQRVALVMADWHCLVLGLFFSVRLKTI